MKNNKLSTIFLKLSQVLDKEETIVWNNFRCKLWSKSDALETMSYFHSVDKGDLVKEMHEMISDLPIINKSGEIFY